MTAHTLGPLIGSDALGFHSDCQCCGNRVEATTGEGSGQRLASLNRWRCRHEPR